MIYLYWYLGIGAVALILMVAFHKLTKKKDDNSLSDVLADIQPERKSLWFRLLNDVLGPALVGTLIVPFWPVLVFFKIKELVFGAPARDPFNEPEFAVTKEDLQAELSIQEIEQREIVFDPLEAAPNMPFGHLNMAWTKFCEDLDSEDSLWSFSANWTSAWGSKDIRQGYAILRGEEIRRYFISVWIDIDEEADIKAVNGEKSAGFGIPAWLRKAAD